MQLESNNPVSWSGTITVTRGAGPSPAPQPSTPTIIASIYQSGTIQVQGSKFPPNATVSILEVDLTGNRSPLYMTGTDSLGTFHVLINVQGCTGGTGNPLKIIATQDGHTFSNNRHCQLVNGSIVAGGERLSFGDHHLQFSPPVTALRTNMLSLFSLGRPERSLSHRRKSHDAVGKSIVGIRAPARSLQRRNDCRFSSWRRSQHGGFHGSPSFQEIDPHQ